MHTPVEILKMELKARGIDESKLPQSVKEALNGSGITRESAQELSNILGTSPEFWGILEHNYQINLMEKK